MYASQHILPQTERLAANTNTGDYSDLLPLLPHIIGIGSGTDTGGGGDDSLPMLPQLSL